MDSWHCNNTKLLAPSLFAALCRLLPPNASFICFSLFKSVCLESVCRLSCLRLYVRVVSQLDLCGTNRLALADRAFLASDLAEPRRADKDQTT